MAPNGSGATPRVEPRLDVDLGRNRARPPQPPAAPTGHIDDDGVIHPSNEALPKDQLHALLVDVYAQTGIKISADDPVVAAALIQSALVRRAGNDAAGELQRCVVHAVAEIAEAVKTERAAAASLDRAAGDAHAQIVSDAKAISRAELSEMRQRFWQLAESTLEQVRSSAQLSQGAIRIRVALGLFVGLALGFVLAIVAGRVQPQAMSAEQVRLMHNGLMLDAAWPKLPPAIRAQIEGAKPSAERQQTSKPQSK